MAFAGLHCINFVPDFHANGLVLTLEGLPGATMSITGIDQPDGRSFAVPVDPDRLRTVKVFVRQPPDRVAAGKTPFKLIAEDMGSNEMDVYDATFDAPEDK